MSVRVMELVFKMTGLTSPQKFVLLSLADHAKDDGTSVYPSVGLLTEKTCLGERTVRRCLSELRDLKVISEIAPSTQHRPTEYAIDLDALSRPATQAGVPVRPSRPATQAARPAAVAPKPLITIKEPKAAKPTPPSEPDPVKELSTVFTEITGIQIIPKNRVGQFWWNPLREMVKLANGSAPALLRQTVEKLHKNGLTISDPNSCIKTFRGLHGTTIVAPPTEHFIDYTT